MRDTMANIYKKRLSDWRNGDIVYQVLVDRFNPSKRLEEKMALYQYPKKLNDWQTLPKPGKFLNDVKYWSHELDYWGGDLTSLMEKLDYIKDLGVEVLYLNPIVESVSNHKYDATDYQKISSEYGTKADLQHLIDKTHQSDMKIMLDGVFNHVGVNNPLFIAAKDETSPYRDWFDFCDTYPEGVRLWAEAKSLPELNLENNAVKDYIYRDKTSVIRSYLNDGVDGWRLDVAFDLGFEILKDLRDHARLSKPDVNIIGEIWNYPEIWLKSIDGVMNFTFREITLRLLNGKVTPSQAGLMLDDTIKDAGIEGILKSWNILDNHDVARLKHLLPKVAQQRLAQVMQFTLPGSPNLYYGTELGMDGGNDPENRAPMRWDLNTPKNDTLKWVKTLIDLHHQEKALKVGDFKLIRSEHFLSYSRYTDDVADTCIIVINPTNQEQTESLLLKDSKLMNFSGFNIILGEQIPLTLLAGLIEVTLKPYSFMLFKPDTTVSKSYTPYKRV